MEQEAKPAMSKGKVAGIVVAIAAIGAAVAVVVKPPAAAPIAQPTAEVTTVAACRYYVAATKFWVNVKYPDQTQDGWERGHGGGCNGWAAHDWCVNDVDGFTYKIIGQGTNATGDSRPPNTAPNAQHVWDQCFVAHFSPSCQNGDGLPCGSTSADYHCDGSVHKPSGVQQYVAVCGTPTATPVKTVTPVPTASVPTIAAPCTPREVTKLVTVVVTAAPTASKTPCIPCPVATFTPSPHFGPMITRTPSPHFATKVPS